MPSPLESKRPRFSIDLAKEHAISQRNYGRLLRLFTQWQTCDSYQFTVGQGRDVTLSVITRDAYSSVFSLQESGPSSLPILSNSCHIRAYHDAKMVDILQWNGVKRFKPRYGYPNERMLARDEKWQLNRLLGEWLNFCLAHGMAVKSQTILGEVS